MATFSALAGFIIVLLPATGYGQSTAQGGAKPRIAAHAYLLRGFLNVFSLGMDELAEKIEQRGIRASVYNHMMWSSIVSDAIDGYKSGRIRSIMIMGHSLGAGAAVSAAEEIGRAGVPVSLVVTFDPVGQMTAPKNVGRFVNLFVSGGWGSGVLRPDGYRGRLENIDQAKNYDVGHISIAQSTALHNRVVAYVVEAAKTGGSTAGRAKKDGVAAKPASNGRGSSGEGAPN